MILLIIDTQKMIMTTELYNFELFTQNIKELIATARKNNIEIIYVRHDDGSGEPLTVGAPGFEIYSDFQPLATDKIINKSANSVFKETELLVYLKSKSVQELIISGIQTDLCIDATIKSAFEH